MATTLRHRSAPALLLLAGALAAACDGGPSSPGADGLPTSIALATRFPDATSGDDTDAYDAADAVRVRLTAGGSTLFQEVLPFDPAAAETRLRVELELEEQTTVLVEVELRRGQDPLFRGSTSLTVTPGGTEEADIDLEPVPAGIEIPESLGPLHSVGETVALGGAVLFATGDTARSLTLSWTALDPDVAEVVTSGGTAMASAVADGEARFRATHASFSGMLTVLVNIQVATVEVAPAASTIDAGETLQLTGTARDALGNALPRTPAWASSNPDVASVDQNGLVTGRTGGTAVITAVVDDVEGEATVEVLVVAPTVQTSPALNVGHRRAQLRSVVNPNGSATSAWFEWGTDPALADPATTSSVSLGSAASDQNVGTTVTGLSPGTMYYFRGVASNEAGTTRGDILEFQTLAPETPTVVTLPATDVGTNSATLNGSVNPNGAAAEAWFEWSDNSSFDGFSSTSHVSVGSGSDEVAVDADLDDIAAESTYYFRAVASNAEGTATGSVLSFRTRIPPPSNLSGGFDGPTVFLSWTDNSTTNTYFRLERSEVSATEGFEAVGTFLDDSADFDSDFGEDGSESDPLPTGTLYYRVLACNAQECSGPSNVLEVVNLPSITARVDYCSDFCFGPGFEVTITGPVSRTATTDSSGFADFPELPVGTYTVTVREDYCPDFRVDFVPETMEVTVSSANDSAFLVFNGNGFMSCTGVTPPPASSAGPPPASGPGSTS